MGKNGYKRFSALTVDVDISVGQREQRRMQRMLGVSEDGVPPVGLLHSFNIQTALLLRQKPTLLT